MRFLYKGARMSMVRNILVSLTLGAALAGCGKPLIRPTVETVVQRVPIAVPAELTKEEPLPALEGDTVGAYLKQRLALLYLVNLYAYRMGLIRELPQ